MDILNFFNDNFWAVATIVSLLTIPITSAINAKFNPKAIWKQVIAWVTSGVLTAGVYFFNLATFNDPAWLSVPATGFVCGLSANGFYDIPAIKAAVNSWFAPLKKKE